MHTAKVNINESVSRLSTETYDIGKEKGKRVFIPRHLYTMYISKCSDMDHTVIPANTPCLPFLH